MNTIIRVLKQPKLQLLVLLVILAAVGLAGQHDWASRIILLSTAVATALAAEWAFFGAVPAISLQSAAITGGIIGMLVSPGSSLLVAWVAAVAAISSKKLFIFRERHHICNPAAAGLLLTTAIFGNQINWWGNSSVIIVVLGTSIILYRIHRLSLPFSYFIGRTLAAVTLGGASLSPSTFLLPNLFFAFIMLVEPKTSPSKRVGQWGFGLLCGVLATVSYRLFPSYEGDLTALVVVNFLRSLSGLRKGSLDRDENAGGSRP